MDQFRGESSQKRYTSASSEASRVAGYSPQLYDGRKKVFVWRYETECAKHATTLSEVNALCGENGQTAICAHTAINVYNKTHSTNYKVEVGGDSNAFSPLKTSDDTFYVHLNCDAIDPMKGKHTFFAELKGVDEPDIVTTVVSLGNRDDDAGVSANSADHNCIYCTGLRHPLTKDFQGFIEEAGIY